MCAWLMAEGLETTEKLSYSERTVKGIIHAQPPQPTVTFFRSIDTMTGSGTFRLFSSVL
jgi:hypothetical protein